jgi:cytochrome o ubiquinol oxidase operon protein cyoD
MADIKYMSYFEDIGLWPKGERLMQSYVLGLALSLVLTGAAYITVTQHLLTGTSAALLLGVLAIAQCFTQLYFFLHLGSGEASRLRLALLTIAALIIAIVLVGSLWVMNNLAGRMMTPQQMQEYMNRQPGI